MMRSTIMVSAATVLLAGAAMAELPASDGQYASDREKAIAALTPEMRDRCLSDFKQKNVAAQAMPIGKLVYNDAVSQQVYHTFYWNGSDKGIAFTVPVRAAAAPDKIVGSLACFYSVTEHGLHFQLSQEISTP